MTEGKIVLVLLDGLRDDTARQHLGFMEGLVAAGQADRRTLRCGLPSVSRSLYHTIHTGLAPAEHGITGNTVVAPSRHPSVFSETARAGRVTAAAAFAWFAELYNGAIPYDPADHREVDDAAGAIRHGRFYLDCDIPDTEVFHQAEMLVRRRAPDYLLVHPMGIDHTGHAHGGESRQYRDRVGGCDELLSHHVPGWLDRGYAVIVTSDHGMDAEGRHGGDYPAVTRVPFYLAGGPSLVAPPEAEADQRAVAPTVLRLLGLPVPETMRVPPLV